MRRGLGSIRLNEGLTLETRVFKNSLRWPIYIIKSVGGATLLKVKGSALS